MLKQLFLPFLVVFLFWWPHTQSQELYLNIGIYQHAELQSILISSNQSTYEIYGDGKFIGELTESTLYQLKLIDSKIAFKNLELDLGKYSKVYFKKVDFNASFKIKSITPAINSRTYNGDLYVIALDNKLQLINKLYLEHYIAGVVEAESGGYNPLEYYKVQSIICRTYALSHLNRHANEGFQLCDQVHCQAFKGKATSNQNIINASNETQGIVLVDENIKLIDAAFHSNCGGTTVNSEQVWTKALPYLRSVSDGYCKNGGHATFKKNIAKSEWLNYFIELDSNNAQPNIQEKLLNFQSTKRADFLILGKYSTSTTAIRRHFKLPSAYFTVTTKSNVVTLEGKGFGHGVGLCQEGAMGMAAKKLTYNQILHHYYTNVHLIHISTLDYFNDAEQLPFSE